MLKLYKFLLTEDFKDQLQYQVKLKSTKRTIYNRKVSITTNLNLFLNKQLASRKNAQKYLAICDCEVISKDEPKNVKCAH